jgi:adenylate cyclase
MEVTKWLKPSISVSRIGDSASGRAEPIAVFEPWPSDAPPTWREAYLAAYAILDNDVAHAPMLLQKLVAERPADLAVRRLAERLPLMRKSDRSPT